MEVFMQKHMIIAQTIYTPQLMNPTKATLWEPDSNTVATVPYKPSAERGTQMSRPKAAEHHNDE